jgi:hypothetical protein
VAGRPPLLWGQGPFLYTPPLLSFPPSSLFPRLTAPPTHATAHAPPPHACRRQAGDPLVKLSVSHALAQSSKLNVYEDRIYELVEEVRTV